MLSKSFRVGLRHSMKSGIYAEGRKPLLFQSFPAGYAILQVSSTAAVIAAHPPYSEATNSLSRSEDGFQCAAALKESLLQSLGQHAASLFWSQESTKVRQDICSDHISEIACTYGYRLYQVTRRLASCMPKVNGNQTTLAYQAQQSRRGKQITHLPCTASGP